MGEKGGPWGWDQRPVVWTVQSVTRGVTKPVAPQP